MLIDGRQLPESTCLKADVAIVGAGAAEISLALELERRSNYDILSLEGGKLERSEESQSLYAGEWIKPVLQAILVSADYRWDEDDIRLEHLTPCTLEGLPPCLCVATS